MNYKYAFFQLLIIALLLTACQAPETWKPESPRLTTRWTKEVSPEKALPEYPRPQLVRERWQNLNGLWDYAIVDKNSAQPTRFDGKILVPFAVESALSGVAKPVSENQKLWYKTIFSVPADWNGERVLLNFGAVDWEATVWVNGKKLGEHKGGYDAFSFDITDALNQTEAQEIVVSVWDPTDSSTQPCGKQVQKPNSIWYTAVTGIWQTVWLEPVKQQHVKDLNFVPQLASSSVKISVNPSNSAAKTNFEISIKDDDKTVLNQAGVAGQEKEIKLNSPKLWSPESPFLYDVNIKLIDENGQTVDEVSSYFGMREIKVAKNSKGVQKLFLNGKDYFQFGFLDQGWWPDGLYTAPTDEALKFDIEMTKKFGFNIARKHVKVEPERWYYWCDKLGLLVWQDMPSGDEHIGTQDPDIKRTAESTAQYELELTEMIQQLQPHPSIVIWVPFNEGWGQFDTERITNYVKKLDPSRLVINTSGWADRAVGDIHDIHSYPGPDMPPLEKKRAVVLGEFGGLGLPVAGHTWQSQDNWGYINYADKDVLAQNYTNLIAKLYELKQKGLSAAIYTQTTDVEGEVNGMMTYDREVMKFDPEQISKVNQGYLPPAINSEDEIFLNKAVVSMSIYDSKAVIRYTTDATEPTKSSPTFSKPLTLTKSTTIKAKTFWSNGIESGTVTWSCEKVDLRAAKSVSSTQKGLKLKSYNLTSNYRNMPDFSALQAAGETVANDFTLPANLENNFGLVYSGVIEVPGDGMYTFSTVSDDGSQVFIDGEMVVNNDGIHGMIEAKGKIPLKKGKYPFELKFYQGTGGKGLVVKWSGPGLKKQDVPLAQFSH